MQMYVALSVVLTTDTLFASPCIFWAHLTFMSLVTNLCLY